MNCKAHDQCTLKGTYCTRDGECEQLSECILMRDSHDGKCPLKTCTKTAECEGIAYCGEAGCFCADSLCYPKKVGTIDVCADATVRAALQIPPCPP